ncbi:MAG: efflux RND transporter periplasmic adaptor subunit [Salinimicrobium sp.]
MKKISLIIFSALALYSCGKEKSVEDIIDEGDLQEIRAKKAELSTQQSELSSQIASLDEAIKELDVNEQFVLVQTMKLEENLFKHYVELPGDVETDQNITVYPEYSGILLNISVKEGDRVQKGQILAKIDDGGLSNQLAQLEAQLALAKTTFERQKRLWDQNIGSEIQYLEAKTNFEAVQNSVNQLKSQLGKTVVRAPFSGVIDELFSDEGEVVAPGQSRLFRLINLSEMYITTAVPENYLGRIKKGTEVMVEIAATGTSFKSTIQQVGNFINPNNRTFEIKVAVPDSQEQVKPNLIATVKLNDYTSKGAITIPESVVQKNAAGESVAYVMEQQEDSIGVAQKRILKLGASYKDSVEVLSGLKAGEFLVTEGAKNLHDGEQVKVKK